MMPTTTGGAATQPKKRGRRRNADKLENPPGPPPTPKPRGRPPKADSKAGKRRKLQAEQAAAAAAEAVANAEAALTPTNAFQTVPERIPTFEEHKREQVTTSAIQLANPNASLYSIYYRECGIDANKAMDKRITRKQKKRETKPMQLSHRYHVLYEVNVDQLVSQPLVEPMEIDSWHRERIILVHVDNWIAMSRMPSQFDLQSTMAINVYYPSSHATLLDHILVSFLIRRPEMIGILLPKLMDRVLQLRGAEFTFPEQPILQAFYSTFAALLNGTESALAKSMHRDACLSILRRLIEYNDTIVHQELNLSYWIAGCLVEASDEILEAVVLHLLEQPSSVAEIKKIQVQHSNKLLLSLWNEEQESKVRGEVGRINEMIIRVVLNLCCSATEEAQNKWFSTIKPVVMYVYTYSTSIGEDILMEYVHKKISGVHPIVACAMWVHNAGASESGWFCRLFLKPMLILAEANALDETAITFLWKTRLFQNTEQYDMAFDKITSETQIELWRKGWADQQIPLPVIKAMSSAYMNGKDGFGFTMECILRGLIKPEFYRSLICMAFSNSNSTRAIKFILAIYKEEERFSNVYYGCIFSQMILHDTSIDGFDQLPLSVADEEAELNMITSTNAYWNAQHNSFNSNLLIALQAKEDLTLAFQNQESMECIRLLFRSLNPITVKQLMILIQPHVKELPIKNLMHDIIKHWASPLLEHVVTEFMARILPCKEIVSDILPFLLEHCVAQSPAHVVACIGEISVTYPDLGQRVLEFSQQHLSQLNQSVIILLCSVCKKMKEIPDIDAVYSALRDLDRTDTDTRLQQLELLKILLLRMPDSNLQKLTQRYRVQLENQDSQDLRVQYASHVIVQHLPSFENES